MRDWPGREHVETLRAWPVLVAVVERIEVRRELYAGAFLLGSFSRGQGDTLSDVDLVAVVEHGRWDDAWARRNELSPDALVTFDRVESQIGGHSWLTPDLIKVECMLAERGGALALYGSVVSLLGDPALQDEFERRPSLTRDAIDEYVDERRAAGSLGPIEAAYGHLLELLHREVRDQ